jgi:hypothetical protein
MPPVGFEPTIPARVRPLTYALDRAATEIGVFFKYAIPKCFKQQLILINCLSVFI